MRLLPCSSCGDLVRSDELACPFCNASLARSGKARVPFAGVVLGASLALSACDKPPVSPAPAYGVPPTATDEPKPPPMAAAYGVAMVTASASAPLPPKPPPVMNSPAPAYGGPPTTPKQ